MCTTLICRITSIATDVTDLELSSSLGKDSVSFANLSSALISADLSMHDSRLPSGAKSTLGVTVNSKLPIESFG